ncbi:MAG TPA: hypothetical protein VHB21_25440, partial [Minicystis sp.]|nr:hypothetical protein [Minicystis sp.]
LSGARAHAAVRAPWRGADVFAPHFWLEPSDCIAGSIPRRVALYGASAYVFYELLAWLADTLGVDLPPAVQEDEYPWGDRYRSFQSRD